MLLSQHLSRRLLSSGPSTAALLPFSSSSAPSLFQHRLPLVNGRSPSLPPLLRAFSSASVAAESDLTLSFKNHYIPSGAAELGLAYPPVCPDKDPVQLTIDKLFVPPEVEFPAGDGGTRVLNGSNIVLGPYAHGATVSTAEFVKSSTRTEGCPSDGLPEFALVGRSNVGKSSLLNSLVKRKRLALISKKPGKTQCINHFRINDSWYLVDLPGYGYAAAPQQLRTDWDKFTKDYFLNRQCLVSVLLLIDASIPAKKIDLDYASWLAKHQIPMTLIFTKCDKRRKKKNGGKRPEENVADFQSLMSEFFETAPPWIMTSGVTNEGRDEILLHLAQLRNYWLKH